MTDEIKHGTPTDQGDYEHQDLRPAGIFYFLLTLALAVVLCSLGLRWVYAFLDRREKTLQRPVSPLITNVPEDTRHVAPGYPQAVFPNPRLEEDERGQLNGIRMQEEKTLYSYGWIDEKAGTLHIPIERAMDLIVQRGLPLRPQGAANQAEGHKTETSKMDASKAAAVNPDKKK